MTLDRLVFWWERGLRLSLCVAIILIGTGPYKLSAWSASRTTFFFWLVWKSLVFWQHRRWPNVLWPPSMPLPLLVFFGAVTASLFPNLRGLSDYRYLFFAVMHCVMVLDLFRDDKSRRFLVFVLGIAPGLLLLRGVVANPQILDLNLSQRLDYPLDHPNTAGHLLAMSIPLCVAVTICARGWSRLLAGASACAQLAAWLLTYSRGAWLGLAVALLFLGYVLGARREILVLAAIATLLVIFVEPLRARFNSAFNVRADTAVTERIQVMRDALQIGFGHPVLGVGYGRGRLKVAIRNSAGSETPANKPIWHAHNLYLELLAGTGFVGLGAYLWLLGRALSCTFHAARLAVGDDKVLTLGIVASAVALIVCGLSDVTFHHHETRLFCFSLLALMLLAHPDRGGVGGAHAP